jgi:hypothetical protein
LEGDLQEQCSDLQVQQGQMHRSQVGISTHVRRAAPILGAAMAKLGGLISCQDVAFDTHQAGRGQETCWRSLHVEKRLQGGCGKARFPLFGGASSTRPARMRAGDLDRVATEVRRALRKDEILNKKGAQTIPFGCMLA